MIARLAQVWTIGCAEYLQWGQKLHSTQEQAEDQGVLYRRHKHSLIYSV